jgi:hypothetical protein
MPRQSSFIIIAKDVGGDKKWVSFAIMSFMITIVMGAFMETHPTVQNVSCGTKK